jgi:hypothetical protein
VTDRVNALLVTLKKDMRDDDVRPLMDAIALLHNVARVSPNISGINDRIAEDRVRLDLEEKLFAVIRGKP